MSTSRGTVFVVDDDLSFLRALSRQISLSGYCVETFPRPSDFLKRERHTGLGCLIVDLRMPDMSGLEFQQQLLAQGCSLPVVFLSGNADIPSSVRAVQSGAVDFLEKPIAAKDLLAAVTNALARHSEMLASQSELQELRERYLRLTPREREVCLLVAQGLLNKQIAHVLGTALRTTKLHRGRVMEKMQAESVADLVRMIDRINPQERTSLASRAAAAGY